MFETCQHFQTMSAPDLADLLTGLIKDIRRVLVHPDLRLDQKLLAVCALVDAAAPPPPPDCSLLAGRPGREREDRAGETAASPSGAALARPSAA